MNDELSTKLKSFEDDHIWVQQNWERLLKEFSDQWIAVEGGRVIAGDPELDGLLAKLSDPSHTCIEYVSREPLEMVL